MIFNIFSGDIGRYSLGTQYVALKCNDIVQMHGGIQLYLPSVKLFISKSTVTAQIPNHLSSQQNRQQIYMLVWGTFLDGNKPTIQISR